MLPTISIPTYNITVPSTKQKVKYDLILSKKRKFFLWHLRVKINKFADALERSCWCVQTSTFDASKLASFDIELSFMNIRAKSVEKH